MISTTSVNQIMFIAAVILGGFALFFAIWYINKNRTKKKLLERIRFHYGKPLEREYYTEEYEAITRFFELTKNSRTFCIDDITWNDLDMDLIFKSMNHTWSSIGESYLYAMLRTPVLEDGELAYRESLVQYMRTHPTEREAISLKFAEIGRSGRHSVFDNIKNLEILPEGKLTEHIAAIIAVFAAVVLLFVNPGLGGVALFGVVVINWSRYFVVKRMIEPYMISCRCAIRMLDAAEAFDKWKEIPELQKEIQVIRSIPERFKLFRKTGRFVVSSCEYGGGLEKVIMDYVNATFHLNLIQFIRMVRELRKQKDGIYELAEHIGVLEASIAIASWRESLQSAWCVPKLDSQNRIQAEQIWHPLIQKPVKNSITARQGVLLTGSNASGKSTFLKTVAVNALLAQTVHTCMADSYKAEYFRLYSSMALRDDLLSSESYYIVEIRSLKRILDAAEGETRILCFVDEVLRGTNTIERIAASSEILKTIAEEKLLCFAATHDMELTYILENYYDNYHFQEEIRDEDVLFNYQLFKGRAVSRNAIKLLNMMGYPKEVTKAAEKRAEEFLKTGEWT